MRWPRRARQCDDSRFVSAVDSDRAGFVRFQVIDTGVGISQEHAPRLFTQGFTTRPDGHGLGLHSAALVAKQLGGSIQGYSDGEGLGATFTFTLPLNRWRFRHDLAYQLTKSPDSCD